MMFAVTALKTKKDNIAQPVAAEVDIIPRLTSNVLFVGASGSGKSTLLVTLVLNKLYWGGWFDKVVIVSPTAKTDDIQKHIKEELEKGSKPTPVVIIDKLEEAPEKLAEIMEEQRDMIEELGADKAEQILLIYDDVVSNNDLMKSNEFGKSFIMSRHFNLTTCLCTQSFTRAPRKCRLQCQNLFYFKGSNSEMELLVEEFAPPGFSKQAMRNLISFCTNEKYIFMHVNRRVGFESRYRKGLGEVIDLSSVPM